MSALIRSAPKAATLSRIFLRGAATRTESDLLGELQVPADHYYGVQTMRGYLSYDITGKRLYDFPNYIKAYGMVKKAAITANNRLGLVPDDKANAVKQACDEVISGKWNSEFIVDMIQGGAGTSTNMNTNEVITNRALEIMGHPRGDYEFISPNDIVNKCQSTNDTYPSSAKLGMYLDHFAMVEQMQLLVDSFAKKAEEFKDVMKMGRTQLQDGVPMTLGQEFHAYSTTLQEDVDLVKEAAKVFLTVNLGGTAIGTGTAAHPDYSAAAVKALREITGFDIKIAPDLINASSNTSGMLYFSGVLRRCAVKLSQICNDLRLLASGPRCGLPASSRSWQFDHARKGEPCDSRSGEPDLLPDHRRRSDLRTCLGGWSAGAERDGARAHLQPVQQHQHVHSRQQDAAHSLRRWHYCG